MKTLLKSLIVLILLLVACHSGKNIATKENKEIKRPSDTVRIANDSLEYEIIIIDAGFSSWVGGRAKPRGYYSEIFLENKNRIYVLEWNSRVSQPNIYDPNLYDMQIDYNNHTNYGYEVNYLLYNYFVYFQEKYKQNLAGYSTRP